MYNVINLTKFADKWAQENFSGKIVKLEAYASKALTDIPVTLKKRVAYKREMLEYVDTLPAPGATKTVSKAYQLPNGGPALYANGKNQQDIVNAYRNGYWDLSWEFVSQLSGAPEDCRRWTLTNFAYVNGVKTTVKSYVYEDEGEAPEGSGIWGQPVYADYPETMMLTATDESTVTVTLIDEEVTVPDTYCSGATSVVVDWSEDVQPQEFTLATLSVAKDSFVFVEPKDSDTSLPYFLGAGDEISIDVDAADANALNVLLYVEN